MCGVIAFSGKCTINTSVSARTDISLAIAIDIGILRIIVHRLVHRLIARFTNAIFIDSTVAVVVLTVADFGTRRACHRACVISLSDIIHWVSMRRIRIIHHKMQVLSGRASRCAHQADDLTTGDMIAFVDVHLLHVQIIGLNATTVIDAHRIAIVIIATWTGSCARTVRALPRRPRSIDDSAIRCSKDIDIPAACNICPRMNMPRRTARPIRTRNISAALGGPDEILSTSFCYVEYTRQRRR